MIDTLENLRSKAIALTDSTQNKRKKARLIAWQDSLYQVECLLHDVHQTGAREDIFRNPAQLLERFLTISKESVSGGADFGPTEQQQEVYDLLSDRLKAAILRYHNALKQAPLPKPSVTLNNARL